MAIYYAKEKNDREVLYNAAAKWKKECLLNDGSLIWDGEAIWTDNNMNRFRHIFIENPDVSGDNFDSKLKKQLENETDDVYKLAIEFMYIYFLFPYSRSISFKTKIKKLEMIAAWKGIEMDSSLLIFEGLRGGLGATGTFYNTNKYLEISFLFLLVEELKKLPQETRNNILSNRIELKKLADRKRKELGKRVQMQHIALHLLLPEEFERIASWGHKGQITKTYADLVNNDSIVDMDEKLFIIRERLQEEYGSEIDFYETSEIHNKWRTKITKNEPSLTVKEPEDGSLIPTPDDYSLSVDFDVIPTQESLIFEKPAILLDQVMTALRNGKHIIFTGPPGTGKSKLASMICKIYNVEPVMVTASSNWSTFETIGGYRPDKESHLYFKEGIFLESVRDKETKHPKNNWLIIDEINRADIDKAFGPLFSVLAGDEVTLPFQSENGKSILLKPQGDLESVETDEHIYTVPKDWRIIATMNTLDKASLYEMSYAFMRRFAFIPVGIPKNITSELVEQYLNVWKMPTYPNVDILTDIWKLINDYRKIGPAIIQDIAKHTQENDDFTSAIILYVLPQFEGILTTQIQEFISRVSKETDAIIVQDYLEDFLQNFFDAGTF
ncbi:AAA family ATPase [Terribacillus saccharophilus]|uniref:AAA family ATPase n=1 Tax=Terribacillus saccharophilus TaxID=361277 RepID=UPI002989B431|nr:AAA family ATPase [Terribacillus saccharophilus]MCM3225943.1 AAA family ATPase [Terribacillus saccharophilus]